MEIDIKYFKSFFSTRSGGTRSGDNALLFTVARSTPRLNRLEAR